MPLVEKYRIPAVRVIPKEVIPNHRGVKSRVLEILSKKAVYSLDTQGIGHADFAAGTSLSGRMTPNRWKSLIRNLPEGTTEVICHPGISDRDLESSYQWGCRWEEELLALTSPEIRQMITDQEITLSRHGENN